MLKEKLKFLKKGKFTRIWEIKNYSEHIKAMLKFGIVFALIFSSFAGSAVFVYLKLPPPRVLGTNLDLYGGEISENAPLTIVFSKSMDKYSVEKSFFIVPKTEGYFKWENKKKVSFYPITDRFPLGEKYSFKITRKAKSSAGKFLKKEYKNTFFVKTSPKVILVSPYKKNKKKQLPVLEQGEPVIVMFDYPIGVEDNGNIIEFTPTIKGKYSSFGKNSIKFVPDKLPMAEDFAAKVPLGIKTKDGGHTEQEYVFKFSSPSLQVVRTQPNEGGKNTLVNKAIKIGFNQEIDLEKFKEYFQFYPTNDFDVGITGKKAFDGWFNGDIMYDIKDRKIDKKTVLLIPKPSLAFEEKYTAVIQKGFKGIEGKNGLEKEFQLSFTTVSPPRIIKSDFLEKNGKKRYFIEFNSEMNIADIKEKIQIVPEVNSPKFISEDEGKKLIFDFDFTPSEQYRVVFGDNIKNIYGYSLSGQKEISFQTPKMDFFLGIENKNDVPSFMPNGKIEFFVSSINIKVFDASVCRSNIKSFIQYEFDKDFSKISCSRPRYWEKRPKYIKNKVLKTKISIKEYMPKIKKGVYFLNIFAPAYRDKNNKEIHIIRPFLVSSSDIKLEEMPVLQDKASYTSLKENKRKILLKAFDKNKNMPVSDMKIKIYTGRGKPVSFGKTDKAGQFIFNAEDGGSIEIFGEKTKEDEIYYAYILYSVPKEEKNMEEKKFLKTGRISIKPVYPKFFVKGDILNIGIKIENGTEKKKIIKTGILTKNVEIYDGAAVKRIIISPVSQEEILWTVSIPKEEKKKQKVEISFVTDSLKFFHKKKISAPVLDNDIRLKRNKGYKQIFNKKIEIVRSYKPAEDKKTEKNKYAAMLLFGKSAVKNLKEDTDLFLKGDKIRVEIYLLVPEEVKDIKIIERLPSAFKLTQTISENIFYDIIKTEDSFIELKAKKLGKGVYKYAYDARVNFLGKFSHPPATVSAGISEKILSKTKIQKIEVYPNKKADKTKKKKH